MATFEPPSAEKLIFSDKTFACLIDCTPKHTNTVVKTQKYKIPNFKGERLKYNIGLVWLSSN